MTTLNGSFAGPGVSDAIAAAKGATVSGTVAGCWPSNSARFVLETSTDGGTTWTPGPGECGLEGADYPGDGYARTGLLNPGVVSFATPKLTVAAQVRIRATAFRSGSAAWTLTA